MRVQALLLAAGGSRRFGGPKLLADLGGEPLIRRSAGNLLRAGLPVHCVVAADDQTVAESLRDIPGIVIGSCPEAAFGMGHSLAYGVSATAEAGAWLVALADMPGIAPGTIRDLAAALREGTSLVAPTHEGCRGHPVGFGRAWLDPLRSLRGDVGARGLIEGALDRLTLIPVDDPGILWDVDTPEDLQGPPAAVRTWPGADG
jgi:molybdenum cofactor cytidylyltransferase